MQTSPFPFLPLNGLRPTRSQEDAVWRTLLQRQRARVEAGMCAGFLSGLARLGLDPARMPRHRDLSRRLERLCGWRIETVPGLIPPRDFFALLAARRFPSPEWIRAPEELDYTPAPDLFHDVFGHLPQLCDPGLEALLLAVAELAQGADDAELARVERIYWFTVEFGLVREGARTVALGAGLASSVAELARSLEDPLVERLPFELERVRAAEFETDRPQPRYFVAPSVDELTRVLCAASRGRSAPRSAAAP